MIDFHDIATSNPVETMKNADRYMSAVEKAKEQANSGASANGDADAYNQSGPSNTAPTLVAIDNVWKQWKQGKLTENTIRRFGTYTGPNEKEWREFVSGEQSADQFVSDTGSGAGLNSITFPGKRQRTLNQSDQSGSTTQSQSESSSSSNRPMLMLMLAVVGAIGLLFAGGSDE